MEVMEAAVMPCYVHAGRDAAKTCAACGNLICDDCTIQLSDTQICKKCLAEAESVPAVVASSPVQPNHAVEPANPATPRPATNWGEIGVPSLIGLIVGATAAAVQHSERGAAGMLLGILFGFLVGSAAFLIGALWVHMIIPAERIRKANGVLGLFGVNDYGKALVIMILAALFSWTCF